MLGGKVFLDLRVKVLKEWQRDPKALQRSGSKRLKVSRVTSPVIFGCSGQWNP